MRPQREPFIQENPRRRYHLEKRRRERVGEVVMLRYSCRSTRRQMWAPLMSDRAPTGTVASSVVAVSFAVVAVWEHTLIRRRR